VIALRKSEAVGHRLTKADAANRRFLSIDDRPFTGEVVFAGLRV
jgi:hypothetical protein